MMHAITLELIDLENFIRKRGLDEYRILDIGTGSGYLPNCLYDQVTKLGEDFQGEDRLCSIVGFDLFEEVQAQAIQVHENLLDQGVLSRSQNVKLDFSSWELQEFLEFCEVQYNVINSGVALTK